MKREWGVIIMIAPCFFVFNAEVVDKRDVHFFVVEADG